MENEVMMNNEVIENTEEVVEAENGKGLIVLAALGLLIVGGIVYKKAIKPGIAKIKAKKAAKAAAEIEEIVEEEL